MSTDSKDEKPKNEETPKSPKPDCSKGESTTATLTVTGPLTTSLTPNQYDDLATYINFPEPLSGKKDDGKSDSGKLAISLQMIPAPSTSNLPTLPQLQHSKVPLCCVAQSLQGPFRSPRRGVSRLLDILQTRDTDVDDPGNTDSKNLSPKHERKGSVPVFSTFMNPELDPEYKQRPRAKTVGDTPKKESRRDKGKETRNKEIFMKDRGQTKPVHVHLSQKTTQEDNFYQEVKSIVIKESVENYLRDAQTLSDFEKDDGGEKQKGGEKDKEKKGENKEGDKD